MAPSSSVRCARRLPSTIASRPPISSRSAPFNMFVMFGKFKMFFFVLAFVSWVVGGATLLAGVVGVSNIMLITVKERTKEFGVRKALGASPLAGVTMVMKESIVLTAIAGLAGMAAGVFVMEFCGAVFPDR